MKALSKPAPLQGRLKLRHLDLFRHVCEQHTLRRAAEAAHMTQPAATKLVRELEEMLGAPLFERDRRGMRPTAYGLAVQRHVSILLADAQHMRREVELLAQGASGRIRLGIIPSIASQLLSQSIASTLQAWPEVRFTLQEGATTELLASLARNELDLSFGRVLDMQQARSLQVVNVYTERFAIACAAGHPLARRRNVPWSELAEAHWALPAAGTPLRELVDGLFTRHAVLRPAVAVESSSFEKLRYLIAGSQLLGMLPRSIALQGKEAKELALVRPELGADFAPISLMHRRDVEPPPLIRGFIRTVQETAKALRLDG